MISWQEVFEKIEKFVQSEIPVILKRILLSSGYDCQLALMKLNLEEMAAIEDYVQTKRELFLGTPYETMATFKFLPGHKQIILDIPRYINHNRAKSGEDIGKNFPELTQISSVMKGLLQTLEQNKDKHPKAFRYVETSYSTFCNIHFFSVWSSML